MFTFLLMFISMLIVYLTAIICLGLLIKAVLIFFGLTASIAKIVGIAVGVTCLVATGLGLRASIH